MKPMFLHDIEAHRGEDNISQAIEMMKRAGPEYPQILHMLAYKPQATAHLERFTHAMLHEEAPLSPGIRELIAAYTSYLNGCAF